MEEATAVSSLQQTEITSESGSEADGFKRGVCKETDDVDGITAPDFVHSINTLLGAVVFYFTSVWLSRQHLLVSPRHVLSLRSPGFSLQSAADTALLPSEWVAWRTHSS